MKRSARIALALALVALVILASATGCSRSRRTQGGSDGPPEASPSLEATAAGDATASPQADDAAEDQPVPQDASAVIRELDAIERELGGMDLPSETDFDALEGEIR